jgi:hypothetical protein
LALRAGIFAYLVASPLAVNARPTDKPENTQTGSEVSQFEQMKQLADAQKAAFEAQKAASDAQKAAIEADIAKKKYSLSGGLDAPTPPASSISLGSDSGKAEVTLLHARALEAAGIEISRLICPKLDAAAPTLILVGEEQIDTSHFLAFKVDSTALNSQLNAARLSIDAANHRAQTLPPAADKEGNGRNLGGILAGADTILGGVGKLASYFNAKYTFGGATPNMDPALLSAEIACSSAKFIIPGNVPASSNAAAFRTLFDLETNASDLRGRLEMARAHATRIATRNDALAQTASAELAAAIQYANAALQGSDAFASALGAATPAEGKRPGPAPISLIARQEFIDTALTKPGARILALRPVSAGAYYTKESLWTFLGGPPLKVMGGAAVAYSLQDAQTGVVTSSGTVIFHGGYRSVRAVEKLFPKIN